MWTCMGRHVIVSVWRAGGQLTLSSQHVGIQDGTQVISFVADAFTFWASDQSGDLNLY